MKNSWQIICILLGILLMMVSAIWPLAVDGRGNWTNEKAARLEALGAGLHQLAHAHEEGPHTHAVNEAHAHDHEAGELAEAERAFQELALELDAARTGPQRTAGWLRWTGIGIAAVGSLAYLAGREGAGTV